MRCDVEESVNVSVRAGVNLSILRVSFCACTCAHVSREERDVFAVWLVFEGLVVKEQTLPGPLKAWLF